jgi:hypothetical protein
MHQYFILVAIQQPQDIHDYHPDCNIIMSHNIKCT